MSSKGSFKNKLAFWRERRAGRCKAPQRRRCADIVEERQRSRCPPAAAPRRVAALACVGCAEICPCPARIIEDYFFLLKKRFGDNQDLEIRFDDRALESFIPPMTLQILIENAVKHNVISKDKPLKIKIYSTTQEIIVENNIQLKKTPEVATGIGLENISKRYRLKAGKEPGIERTGEFFRVKLPLIE